MAKDRTSRSEIYLIAAAGLDPEALKLALDAGSVACVLLHGANLDDEALQAAVKALRPIAQECNVAFLIEDRARLAHRSGCDGVHLTEDGLSIKHARQEVGDQAIVGVYCGDSRHAGMLAADAGADYVAFGGGAGEGRWERPADPELLAWWQALVTTPCVAVVGRELQTAAAMAAAGADFVAVGTGIWCHPHGPDGAIRELHALLGGDGHGPNTGQARDD